MYYVCDYMDIYILLSWSVDVNFGGVIEGPWVGLKGMIRQPAEPAKKGMLKFL